MEAPNENPASQAITGNFSLTAQLPHGKTFTVSGYIYDSESVESLNARVDALHDVTDRQRTRAEIPELEAKLDGTVSQLDGLKAHYITLGARKDSGAKLTGQEKQQLEVMDTNVKHLTEQIAKGRDAIAAAKSKVGIA